MSVLETRLHADLPGIPVLVKAELPHVRFETIHPFLGRLLLAFLLCRSRDPRVNSLLQSVLQDTGQRYYELIDRIRTAGDSET